MYYQKGYTSIVVTVLIVFMAAGLVGAAWWYESNKDDITSVISTVITQEVTPTAPAPTILSIKPDKLTTYTALSEVSITFDQQMDKETINEDSFYVLQGIGEKVPGRVVYNQTHTIFTYAFNEPLVGTEDYPSVTITTVVKPELIQSNDGVKLVAADTEKIWDYTIVYEEQAADETNDGDALAQQTNVPAATSEETQETTEETTVEEVAVAAEIVGTLDLPGWKAGYVAAAASPSEVELRGWGLAMAKSGDYVYVADGPAGLQVINVSKPNQPEIAGSLATGSYASSVSIFGNYAYVGETNGMKIVDISNPASPTLTGSFTSPTQSIGPRDVSVYGKYAYLTYASGSIDIVDISDQTNPTLYMNPTTPAMRSYNTSVNNGYIYLLDNSASLEYSNDSAMTVFDTEIAEQSKELGYLDVYLDYIFNQGMEMTFYGDTGYLETFDSIIALDLAGPRDITELGRYDEHFVNMTNYNSMIYALKRDSSGSTIKKISFATPSSPVFVSQFNHPDFTTPRGEGLADLESDGQYVYALRAADVPPGGEVIAPAKLFVIKFK